MKKVLALAWKLKALWQQGEPGERENARLKLTQLLQKHGLTDDDIEEEKKERRFFRVMPDQETIFVVIVCHVLGSQTITEVYRSAEDPTAWCLVLNNSDFVEIDAKFDFYWRAYNEEYNIFLMAFVSRQDLHAKDAKPSEKPPTEKEILAYLMGQKMEKRLFRIQIGDTFLPGNHELNF